jgi:stage II sporulation protein D
MDVILTMPSERYVAAVLNAEASANEPRESLRALAVLVRTYALNGRHYNPGPGHLAADLCDSTQCQAIRLTPPSQAVEDAVAFTTGETLWFGDRRAEVFFSQHCGGMTEDASAAWPGHPAVPYLRSHPDLYCLKRGPAAWHAEVALPTLEEIARKEGWKLPADVIAASVSTRSTSQRALRVTFRGAGGESATVSANALRFGIGRAVGWDEVRSDAFEAAVRNGSLIFDGHGHGHGVGLCQTGAAEMAEEGRTASEILAFYFPGTAARILPGDDGWQETRIGTLAVRATRPLSAQLQEAIAQTWIEAQSRFASRQPIAPEVIFAPSTEIFRQMTAQPGWALASTRDKTIVLQPDSVLFTNGRDLRTTLLHEMLHVLVESECNPRTPLWLREGLVEALAEPQTIRPGSGHAAVLTLREMDRSLRNAASLAEANRAHRAAADRVRALLARYGLPAVRGWLSSGVPAGAA